MVLNSQVCPRLIAIDCHIRHGRPIQSGSMTNIGCVNKWGWGGGRGGESRQVSHAGRGRMQGEGTCRERAHAWGHCDSLVPELVNARQQTHCPVPHVSRVVDKAVAHLHLSILQKRWQGAAAVALVGSCGTVWLICMCSQGQQRRCAALMLAQCNQLGLVSMTRGTSAVGDIPPVPRQRYTSAVPYLEPKRCVGVLRIQGALPHAPSAPKVLLTLLPLSILHHSHSSRSSSRNRKRNSSSHMSQHQPHAAAGISAGRTDS